MKELFLFSFLSLVLLTNVLGQNSGFELVTQLGINQLKEVKDFRFSDLDNDGDNDLIVQNNFEIGLYENQGSGKFASYQKLDSSIYTIHSFDVGDVDNDGDLDIIWYNHFSFLKELNPFFIENLGGNLLFSSHAINYPINEHGFIINNNSRNGFKSLVALNQTRRVRFDELIISQGGAIDSIKIDYSDLEDVDLPRTFLVDIDKDSTKDVFGTGFQGSNFLGLYFAKKPEDIIQLEVKKEIETTFQDVLYIDAGNDGHKDIFVSTFCPDYYRSGDAFSLNDRCSGYIFKLENEENGLFSEPQKIDSAFFGFQDFEIYDVDGNGFQDIIAIPNEYEVISGPIVWYPNSENGFGERMKLIESDLSFTKIRLAEIDGDSESELIASVEGDKKLIWIDLVLGGELEVNDLVSSTFSTPQQLLFGKINGDTKEDLLISSYGNGIKAFIRSNSFEFEQPINIGDERLNNIVQAELFDVDQDGTVELYALTKDFKTSAIDKNGSFNYSLFKYEDSGGENFSYSETIFETIKTLEWNVNREGFIIADITGNGKKELFLTGVSSNPDSSLGIVFTLENNSFVEIQNVNFGTNGGILSSGNMDKKDGLEILSTASILRIPIEPRPTRPPFTNELNSHTILMYDKELEKFVVEDSIVVPMNSGGLLTSDIVFSEDNEDPRKTFQVATAKYSGSLAFAEQEKDILLKYESIENDLFVITESIYRAEYESAYSVELADMDNDGWEDIVFLTKGNHDIHAFERYSPDRDGKIMWSRNKRDNTFLEPEVIDTNFYSPGKEILLKDLNGDEQPEIIVSGLKEGEILVYKNNTKPLVTSSEDESEDISFKFELEQNYPNPFNPTTKIEYSLSKTSEVKLEVYNILGQRVKLLVDQRQKAGKYFANFNASDLSSGVYIYMLKTESKVLTKKMLLIK